ncbi:MAG: hypothetical protein NZ480_05895 [Bdellovibrionaceae bacterium]|nr:hypothetical protein [Pseudobdellovibrionaceae bacterium]MDW8190295.1 hypothetical protein [Pseudobdellovibrionaceae bacterium]
MEVSRKIGEIFVLYLPYIMLTTLAIGIFLRTTIFFTLRRYELFIREFEKRVNRSLEFKEHKISFYQEAKHLLEKSYYEYFAIREKLKRRKYDAVATLVDRVFMIRQGIAWFIQDTLQQLRTLKWTKEIPDFTNISRSSFHKNPFFHKSIGIFPVAATTDMTNIFPGLFVVCGILGTFIGISKGLPELAGMSVTNVENSRLIMDRFLNEVSYAMKASILGITSSIIMNLYNTWLSPERVYISINDRLDNSLTMLWHHSDNNDIPSKIFEDEHIAADDMLAHQILEKDLAANPRGRALEETKNKKAS